MRLRGVPTWLPVLLLLLAWTAGWALAWQSYLFDFFESEPRPGLHIFRNEQGNQKTLLIGAGIALGVGGLGVFLVAVSGLFKAHSLLWSRVWLGGGALLTVIALSGPVLFPSTTNLVVDEGAEVVAKNQHWLYAATSEAIAFDSIERVSLRVRHTLVPAAGQVACQRASGLTIVKRDGHPLKVPNGFDHDAVARRVAEAASVPLEDLGFREC